jgi:hypothetical protein
VTAATAAAVKRYSNIGVLRAATALSLFFAAVAGSLAVLLWTLPRDVAPTGLFAAAAGVLLVFLGFALFSFRGACFWTRQDAKRQAAVRGAGTIPPLAIEQPIPRDMALSTSSRIAELRMKPWLRPMIWVVVAAACAFFSYDSEHDGPILGFSFCGIVAVALLVISVGIQATLGQYVILEGI